MESPLLFGDYYWKKVHVCELTLKFYVLSDVCVNGIDLCRLKCSDLHAPRSIADCYGSTFVCFVCMFRMYVGGTEMLGMWSSSLHAMSDHRDTRQYVCTYSSHGARSQL